MSQKRTIMSACDYSIESMKNIKKGLMDLGGRNQELSWAIGGIIVILTANLIRFATHQLEESLQKGEPNSREDLIQIQIEFNEFITQMINGKE